jgi:hypothetical protein
MEMEENKPKIWMVPNLHKPVIRCCIKEQTHKRYGNGQTYTYYLKGGGMHPVPYLLYTY